MKVSVDFGRWTTTKAVRAVAGALMIGGAVGSAVALSPTLPVPIKWQGGWELSRVANGPAGSSPNLYTVPTGVNLMVTDLTLSNPSDEDASFNLYSAASNCATNTRDRLQLVQVPRKSTVQLSYQTGIGFTAGQTLCVATPNVFAFNARGFFFNAATPPAN